MGIHKKTHVRRYPDEIIARIQDLCWNEKKSYSQISEELNIKHSTLRNLIHEYAIGAEPKRYRLPKFKGWDFSADNLELPRGQ